MCATASAAIAVSQRAAQMTEDGVVAQIELAANEPLRKLDARRGIGHLGERLEPFDAEEFERLAPEFIGRRYASPVKGVVGRFWISHVEVDTQGANQPLDVAAAYIFRARTPYRRHVSRRFMRLYRFRGHRELRRFAFKSE